MTKEKTEKAAWAKLAKNNRRKFLRGLSQRLVVVTNKISFIGHEYAAKDVAAALDAQTNSAQGTNSVKRRFLDEQGPKYKALQQHISSCRKWFSKTTSPYLSNGVGLVPTDEYASWSAENIKRRDRFDELVRDFLSSWDDLTQGPNIRKNLAGAFDPDRIPELDDIERKISWTHTATPLGDTFGSSSSNLISQELVQVYEKTTQQTVSDYVSSQYSRLAEVFDTLGQQLERRASGIDQNLSGNKSRVNTNRLTDAHNALRDLAHNNITECPEADDLFEAGKRLLDSVSNDDPSTTSAVTDNVTQLRAGVQTAKALVNDVNKAKITELEALQHAFG